MPGTCGNHPHWISIRGIYVLLFAAGLASAASWLCAQPAQVRQITELPPALTHIVEASRQTPPEFHAYALLVLVESGRVAQKPLAFKLLGEALETAQLAAQKISRFPAIGAVNMDSDVGIQLLKREFGLDQTSLAARAIADAEKLDPAAARALFEQTNWPESQPAGCHESMVDDPQPYYDLLARLAREKFANRKDGKDPSELLLEAGIDRIRTHRDAELALRAIQEAGLTAGQYEQAIQLYLDRLVHLSGDERGFASRLPQLQNLSNSGWIGNLKTALERVESANRQALLRSARTYLVENLRAGVCGENWAWPRDEAGKPQLPRGIVSFNQQLAAELDHAGIEPISASELGPRPPASPAEVHLYGQSSEAHERMTAAKQLRFDANGAERTPEDRNSAAWIEQFTRLLGLVDDWPADPFHSEDNLWTKMSLYTSAIDLAPKVEQRQMAMERAVSMLENSSLETEDPALEMVLTSLLHLRSLHRESGASANVRDDGLLSRRLANSSSPSLRLLGRMEAENLKALRDSL
jgi:hypothetical protein